MANEQVTIALARDRDSAITALFMAHHARLVALAKLLVDDLPTAEDVVQDAFTSLHRRWPWIDDKAAALHYLHASVVNGARSSLRRRGVVRTARFDPPPPVPSPESCFVASEEGQALQGALARLPLRQRQVIVLRYYLDWSEKEIADALGISRGSVKQHTYRAMTALSTQLEAAR